MQFTATTLLAAITEFLASSGFRAVSLGSSLNWGSSHVRLFEDPYSLAAVVVYDTSLELFSRWPDAQAALVDVVSERLARTEAKAWDIYLVLLTPAFVGDVATRDVNTIRFDTSRVRKLVATGDELQTLEDVKRTVLPLLPVSPVVLAPPRDVLDQLVDALAARGIDREDVRRIANAFAKNEPLIAALKRGSDED